MELCRAKQLPELPWCPRAGDRSRVRSSTNSSDPADSRERSTQEEFGRGEAKPWIKTPWCGGGSCLTQDPPHPGIVS